jgi:hypothetical protein
MTEISHLFQKTPGRQLWGQVSEGLKRKDMATEGYDWILMVGQSQENLGYEELVPC